MRQLLLDLMEAESGGLLNHLIDSESLLITRENYLALTKLKEIAKQSSLRSRSLQARFSPEQPPILDHYDVIVGCYNDMNLPSIIPDLMTDFHQKISMYEALLKLTEAGPELQAVEKLKSECQENWQTLAELKEAYPAKASAGYLP